MAASMKDEFGRGGNERHNSGRDAIVKVLRRYFDHRVSAGGPHPVKSNEVLIIKALKNYFKGDAWT